MILSGPIQLIVFDLDGTLYEDTHHFQYNAQRINEELPKHIQPQFEKEYALALENKHPLKIGRIYDVVHDRILVQKRGTLMEVYNWEGHPVAEEEMDRLYPERRVEVNLDTMISIGDMWWLASTIARHYGMSDKLTYEAFLETREYMMGPEFSMSPVPGLKEVLEELRETRQLVLLTNSPEPDSTAIVKKLGLFEVFHQRIFQARKPTRTMEHFQHLMQKNNLPPEAILSVGDNAVNEIFPAKDLGCQTIYIDAHGIGGEGDADCIVSSVKDVVALFQKEFLR